MCGRYHLNKTPSEIAAYFPQAWQWHFAGRDTRRFNIAPSQPALVVREREGRSVGEMLVWGFQPPWLRDPSRAQINARAETAFSKPMFREAARDRRCLVLATGWYEWRGSRAPRQPFVFQHHDTHPFAFAGIWTSRREGEADTESFAIVTVAASALVAPVHDRMPCVLRPEDYAVWLGGSAGEAAALLRPDPLADMEAVPVSDFVNKPDHEGEECMRPARTSFQPDLFG